MSAHHTCMSAHPIGSTPGATGYPGLLHFVVFRQLYLCALMEDHEQDMYQHAFFGHDGDEGDDWEMQSEPESVQNFLQRLPVTPARPAHERQGGTQSTPSTGLSSSGVHVDDGSLPQERKRTRLLGKQEPTG